MSLYDFSTFGGCRRITPSDLTTYTDIKRLIVDAVGTLTIVDQAGNSVTLAAVVVGQIITVAVAKVMSTGTTATVVGLS